MSMSSELVIVYSICDTSPLILAMMSPFLCCEKKDIGSEITLLYTCMRISRTIPVLNGIITADDAK